MKYDHGTGCWQGPNRSTTVSVQSNPDQLIFEKSHDATCHLSFPGVRFCRRAILPISLQIQLGTAQEVLVGGARDPDRVVPGTQMVEMLPMCRVSGEADLWEGDGGDVHLGAQSL